MFLLQVVHAVAQEEPKVACHTEASDHEDADTDQPSPPEQAETREMQAGGPSAESTNADDHENGPHQRAAQADCDNDGGEAADESGSAQDDADAKQALDGRPNVQVSVDRYHDSQHYDTMTVASDYFVRRNRYSLNLNDYAVFAHDQKGDERAVVSEAAFSADLSEQFALAGGLGLARSGGTESPLGFVRFAGNSGPLDFELKFSSDPVVSSAQTIRRRVWQNALGSSLNWEVTERLTASLELHRTYYSDANSSLEADFSPQYTIPLPGSQLILGYDFNYTSFARNPNAGYWAPQPSIVNQGSVAWAFTRNDYFGRIQLAGGPEMVQEAAQKNNNPDGPSSGWGNSAMAAMGWRPTENMTLQSYWATDRSAQWNSTATGVSLNYLF